MGVELILLLAGVVAIAAFAMRSSGEGAGHSRAMRGDHILKKRNDGRGIDARLPRHTTIVEPGYAPEGGAYFPKARRVIVDDRNNPRRRYHEKGHLVWDLKLSQKQRDEFIAIAKREGTHMHGTRQTCKDGRCFYPAEELYAGMYAAHKQDLKMAKPYKQFFKKTLKR